MWGITEEGIIDAIKAAQAVRGDRSGRRSEHAGWLCDRALGSGGLIQQQEKAFRREIPYRIAPTRNGVSEELGAVHQLRVIAPANTSPEVTDAAFNQLRQYGRSSAAVTIRLLETIAVVAGFVHRPEDRTTLLRHAEMIARGAMEGLPEREDRRAVEERCQAAIQLCSEAGASCR